MKFTASTIAKLQPRAARYSVFDDGLPGFGIMLQPSGAASFICEYRPLGGGRAASKRRATLGALGKVSLDDARKMAKALFAQVADGKDPMAARREAKAEATVLQVSERWLAHIERTRKPRTHSEYKKTLDGYVLPSLGSKPFSKLVRTDMRRIFDKLSVEAPVAANRVLAVVSSMWSWMAAQEAVTDAANPTKRIARNEERGRERYLNDAELSRLGATLRLAETEGLQWIAHRGEMPSKHARKPENRRTVIAPGAIAAVRLLLFTSCRLREVLHLQWTEIDFERGVIRLGHERAKAGRRDVPLSAAALEVLSGVPREANNPHVFAGSDGKPRSDLKRPWTAITAHAGLDALRIHDLRHTGASVGAGAGLSLHTIGGLLGHRTAASTHRYSHLDSNPLRRAANTVGEHIRAAMGEGIDGAEVVPLKPQARA